jgi:phage tail sheath protein FI
MATYLSPGVYLEEADTGNKPIEGVSTSTAGLVGVTERGPANVPTLVTSFGDYRRIFGGYLPIKAFTNPQTHVAHCYLPHAVEGLFTNGGKRVYITRVTAPGAARANRRLFFNDPLASNPPPTVLLRAAEEGTGTAGNPPDIYVLDGTGLGQGMAVRIGDGSRVEYRSVAAVDPVRTDVAVNLPLQAAHPVGTTVQDVPRQADQSHFNRGDFKLLNAAAAGATELLLGQGTNSTDLATLGANHPPFPFWMEVNSGSAPPAPPPPLATWSPAWSAEYVAVTGVTVVGGNVKVTLSRPLQLEHSPGEIITALKLDTSSPPPTDSLALAANANDSLLYLQDGTFQTIPPALPDLVVINPGGTDQEVRRIATLSKLTLAVPSYEDYPAGSVVQGVILVDDARNLMSPPPAAPLTNKLDDVTGLEIGMQLVFTIAVGSPPVTHLETGVIAAITPSGAPNDPSGLVTLLASLTSAPSGSVLVQPRQLKAQANAGTMTIQLDARIGLGLDPNKPDVLRIGSGTNVEYVTVLALSEPRAAAPDAGTVVIDRPLERTYLPNTPVARELTATDPTRPWTLTLMDAPTGTQQLLVVDGENYGPGNLISVRLGNGDRHYHALDGSSAATPHGLQLDKALKRSHTAGSTLTAREPIFEVRALDTGDWGNRVMVTSADEEVGLLPHADVITGTASPAPGIPSTMRLNTVTGIEPGTVLELRDHDDTQQIGDFLKVRSVDRTANNLVTFDPPGLSPAQVAAITSAGTDNLIVKSREFRMEVMLQAPPNPALPIRNDDLLDRELFRTLSMDPRHSHYFERVIGAVFDDGAALDDLQQPLRRSDRRSEGGSQYVRVRDLGASPADKERVRLGPEPLIDVLPSGLTRAARLKLGDGESNPGYGTDSVPLMGDDMYTGTDDREPDKRTGIFALKNALDISLIACPGQVSPTVQQALIDQCEDLRYRFAVLDAQGPADDTIDDVTAQRQNFDTKYAAFYHPWLTIPDPFPSNLAAIPQFPIPPSGHILGIYARVDDQRGVHKAPANEVVGGMTGLTRYLNQQEQDILNAFPVNIDLIRDFRVNSRGIRVWGARVITSDSDWKYVNVRRLLIFIEDSLDRGLQWVVFEPNDEALWARVRRSITNFLTTVWRNGALEGTTRDQAFYVKCDRTTMTQDDIDNGRLIAVVGVAPVKPAEFVIIRIGLWTADASS